jgi:branched-chain amino acid transport system substrate-binding protein
MKFKKSLAAIACVLASTAIYADQVVKIGHAGPLSGNSAVTGRDNERGVRLAVDEANAAHIVIDGQPIRFELISEDDQSDPRVGVAAAQKLVDQGVKVVIGHYNSGVTIPASRIYNEASVVMITGAASNPKLTQQGFKYIFRLAASDSVMGARVAQFAKNQLNAKKVAVIDDRTAYGQGVAEVFESTAKSLGIEVVSHDFTTDKALEFSSILTSIKANRPDVVFYGGYYGQAAPIGRQMKQLGLDIPLLGGDGICSSELAKLSNGALEGRAYCAEGGSPLDKLPAGAEFRKKFKAKFGADVDVYAPAFYSATWAAIEAMKAANSIDPKKFVQNVAQIGYTGVVGRIRFDSKGDWVDAPVTIYTIKQGQLVPVN